METEILGEVIPSGESAFASIAEIKQRIAAMGANDSEFFLIIQVEEKLRSGEIDPTEAVTEAKSILGGKQDYH